jgi:hypothetical protein
VRWGTAHEAADCADLIGVDIRLADDFARALDKNGWMIVSQDDARRWPMCSYSGSVPAWADDYASPKPKPKPKPTLRVIDGSKTEGR